MNTLLSNGKVYISRSNIPKAGRGVFAGVNIRKGEIIESCPVLEIPAGDASKVNDSILNTYIYYLGKDKGRMMLALGFGSIYNHTYHPNAVYKGKLKEARIDFVAIKEIVVNDEITVNYSQGNQKGSSPLWLTIK